MKNTPDRTTYVALLRAVNLAGRNSVGMADLRQLLTALGFDDARSLLQSGNLLFRADTRTAAQLEPLLENAASKRLGLDTVFFVRTAQEWKAIVTGNPFPAESRSAPGRLVVTFLKDTADRQRVAALGAVNTGREVVRAKGRHAYIVYPDGIGRSRLTIALIEKTLGTRATARNWNTILKLSAAATE